MTVDLLRKTLVRVARRHDRFRVKALHDFGLISNHLPRLSEVVFLLMALERRLYSKLDVRAAGSAIQARGLATFEGERSSRQTASVPSRARRMVENRSLKRPVASDHGPQIQSREVRAMQVASNVVIGSAADEGADHQGKSSREKPPVERFDPYFGRRKSPSLLEWPVTLRNAVDEHRAAQGHGPISSTLV
jgi:hypothetical protein